MQVYISDIQGYISPKSLLTISPRTYKRSVVDATPPPSPSIRLLFHSFKTIFYQHLPFSVAVGISLTRILTQVWWETVVFHLFFRGKKVQNVEKKQPSV